MASKTDESFPTPPPPPHVLSGGTDLTDGSKAEFDVEVYHSQAPFSALPPPPLLSSLSFSPGLGCSTQVHTPFPVFATPSYIPKAKFVTLETPLYRTPGVTTCPYCETRVTTEVVFRVGAYAWLMCLVFVLCGLVLGCCLIPFFVKRFKDAYHTCPRCRRVLHVQRRSCCSSTLY